MKRDGNAATIIGTGEMDLSISEDLDIKFADAIASTKDVTIDFREALFIDSAILASLVKAGKALMNAGARLKVIVIAGTHPDYVLKTVGFAALMDIDIVERDQSSS